VKLNDPILLRSGTYVFDCRGTGQTGNLSVHHQFESAEARFVKWAMNFLLVVTLLVEH